jgi:hypothetical protein
MNVDLVLTRFNAERRRPHPDWGHDFFIVHQPVATFDIGLWITDTEANRRAEMLRTGTAGS